MKLLGWMNQILKQNSIEPLKNFSIGNSCSCLSVQPSFDEQQYYLQPSKSSVHSKQAKRACPKYSTGLTANKEEVLKDKPSIMMSEPSIMMSELFHGFLTIGTLGSEPITKEPTTPRFAISFENENEKETEVTENELKLINDELEKFLEAEAKEVENESSGRSSYVSIITLSGNQIEGVEVEEHKNMVSCPLQGYLFGSSIENSETNEEMKKEKGSLGELFKKHSIAYEQYKGQSEEKGTHSKGTYAMHFMKKMLKKIHIPSRSCTPSVNGHAANSVTTKRKLPKKVKSWPKWIKNVAYKSQVSLYVCMPALRMLHRRIHPERSTADKKFTKSHKSEKKNFSQSGKHQDQDVTFLGNANQMCLRTTMLKEEITSMSLSHNRLSRSHSTGNGEHWIKTDADYLVLEL